MHLAAPAPSHTSPQWPWTLALFLPPLLLWASLQFGVGFSGFYGQDSHAYLDYSRRIQHFLAGGPVPGPFFWPANFSFLGAISAMAGGSAFLWLPLLSALSFAGLMVLFRNAIMTFHHAQTVPATIFTMLTLGISPAFLRASAVAMSDMLALSLVFATFFWYHRFSNLPQLRWALLTCSAAGLALGTRYAVAPLLLPFGLAFGWVLLKKGKIWWLALAGAALLAGLLPTWWVSGSIWGWLPTTQVHSFSFANMLQSDFPNHTDGHLSYAQINLAFFSGPFYRPDYCLLIPLLLLLSGPRDFQSKSLRLGFAAACFYLLFLAGLQVQNPRFILPALPFLVLPTYSSWVRLLSVFSMRTLKIGLAILWISASLYLANRLLQPLILQDRLEKQVAQSLEKLGPGPLYTFGMDIALPTHGVNRPIVSLWGQTLTHFDTPSFALFNTSLFSQQWANQLPMANWEKLNANYQLKPLQSFANGWQLFRVE